MRSARNLPFSDAGDPLFSGTLSKLSRHLVGTEDSYWNLLRRNNERQYFLFWKFKRNKWLTRLGYENS